MSWKVLQDARSRQLQLVATAAAEAAEAGDGGAGDRWAPAPVQRAAAAAPAWLVLRRRRWAPCSRLLRPAGLARPDPAAACLPAACVLPPGRLDGSEAVLHVALHVPHAPHLVSEEWLVLESQVGAPVPPAGRCAAAAAAGLSLLPAPAAP